MTPLVAYVPVIHRGYINLFSRYPDALFVMNKELLDRVEYLSRDARACDPEEVAIMVKSLGIVRDVMCIGMEGITAIALTYDDIIMPDEEISRAIAKEFFDPAQVRFEEVFLRWHQQNVASEVDPKHNRAVTNEELHREFLRTASAEAVRSSDWWRQVGACAVRNEKMLLSAHNTHYPAEQTPYIVGDPRTPFSWGQRIDVSSAGHAEREVIGEAARLGIPLQDADLYVTTFPCPGCAIQVARAGFRRVFYRDGYSLAAADEILRSRNVELIRVV